MHATLKSVHTAFKSVHTTVKSVLTSFKSEHPTNCTVEPDVHMSSLEGCRTADPRDTFAFPLQCFYQCTFCHCVYLHCTAVLSAIAPVHCSIALHHCPLHHCIALPLPLRCSIATMLHFIGTFHLTIALFLSMHTLPLHLRPLQLLSLHFYLESLFLLTLQYISIILISIIKTLQGPLSNPLSTHIFMHCKA